MPAAATRRSCPRTPRSCSRFPTTCPTSWRCSPIRSRCRCTPSPGTHRPQADECSCTARARSARARSRSCARLYPDVEVGVVARFESQGELARKLGASAVFAHSPVKEMIEPAADWSGGVLRGDHDLPMAYPGGIDVVYDTISKKESLEASVCVAQGARHAREGRGARAHVVGVDPPVLQGDQLGRLQRVRPRGGRRRAQARHQPLPRPRELRPRRPLRHAHAQVRARRLARRVHRARHPGGVRRDQDRVRPGDDA